MESQPQNPEFVINPENFHPCGSMGELFVCVNALHPSQQFFSHVRTIPCLLGLNQF